MSFEGLVGAEQSIALWKTLGAWCLLAGTVSVAHHLSLPIRPFVIWLSQSHTQNLSHPVLDCFMKTGDCWTSLHNMGSTHYTFCLVLVLVNSCYTVCLGFQEKPPSAKLKIADLICDTAFHSVCLTNSSVSRGVPRMGNHCRFLFFSSSSCVYLLFPHEWVQHSRSNFFHLEECCLKLTEVFV